MKQIKHPSTLRLSGCDFFRALSVTLLLAVAAPLPGQSLLSSRHSGYYCYIFKITDAEAGKILRSKNTKWMHDRKYFHSVVDSFPLYSAYSGKLAPGHYIKASVKENTLEASVTTVLNVNVQIINNNTDLCVRVYDQRGDVVNDASVKAGGRSLKYDSQIMGYLLEKTSAKGILEVKYNGTVSSFDLTRTYHYSCLRRFESVFLFGTPLKYIWVPVKFAASAPYIAIRDLVRGDSWSIGNDLRYSWQRNGLFTKSYGNNLKKGYFVFNKPVYMPGDTVRFKAFLVSSRGIPLKKELEPVISKSWDKNIIFAKIKPSVPGNYNGSFVLADSLGLDLDKYYNLDLKKGKRAVYATKNFKFEDYELKSMSLVVRTDSDTQVRRKLFRVYIRATDENDLNIQDGRIELNLLSGLVSEQFRKNIFVKDTLFSLKQLLKPAGETVLTIPDSIFPEADLSYSLDIKVFRSDNEYKSFNKAISFYDHKRDISYELHNDSILFILKENGLSIKAEAEICGIDRFGYSSVPQKIKLPLKEKINPAFEYYKITAGSLTSQLKIENESSLISCQSERVNDSLNVKILNPRNIPFTWFLYKANRLESKGYGNSFDFHDKMNRSRKYLLAVAYLWSGTTRNETFDLSGNKNVLSIKLEQPPVVFPGKKVSLTATVTDYSGRPVAGADITAFSYTSKFRSSPSGIYSFPDNRKTKKLYYNSRLENLRNKENQSIRLDWDYWQKIFSLDTIQYYRFFHHNEEIWSYSYNSPDGITQFAPFIVSKGTLVPVNIIYVDLVPVYFSWTKNTLQPYSFRVSNGYHLIGIRTRDKNILIDSVRFENGKKLIMSINDLDNPHSYRVSQVKPGYFTDYEKAIIARYLFPYRNNFNKDFAYIQQGDRFTILNSPENQSSFSYNNNYSANGFNLNVAGPVNPQLVMLKVPGAFSYSFTHEQGFDYEFFPSLIKMRTDDREKLIPRYIWDSQALEFTDSPLSEERIIKNYNDYLFREKIATAKFDLPKSTLPPYGALFLKIDSLSAAIGQLPLFVILMPQNHLAGTKVYPGNTTLMHNLNPGLWSLFLYYRGDLYSRYDSIQVNKGGKNYLHLPKPGIPVSDSLSKVLNNIIEDQVYKLNTRIVAEFQDYVRQSQRQQALTKFSGSGFLVSGTVSDHDEALPGVMVMVKGTNIGTVTDINGHYSLVVPYDNKELSFSFIGYKPVEMPVSSEIANVNLEPEVLGLNEVVVVGYGMTKALSGRVAGLNVTSAYHEPILIRGNSTMTAADHPLFIIDGVPFNGDISDLDPMMMTNINVIRDASLTSLYGSRAANGVVMINTSGMDLKSTKFKSLLKGAQFDSAFIHEAASASSIRSRFSDYAYWKPTLVTDINGKVSFEVKFPDDVTSWSTYLFAMNGKKQSGMTSSEIKSYKPLLAQLYTPRFLIEGDSANLIAKVQNYSSDPIQVNIHYELNDKPVFEKKASCENSLIDTLPLSTSSTDTLKAKYYFEMKDGYLDGELRKIAVYRKGLEMTSGKFCVLNRDTSTSVIFNPKLGKGKLYAQTDRLDVISGELDNLIVYYYECNEQLASKLYALLSQETICKYRGKPFLKKMLVARIIRSLEKNQNPDGCWGWWDRSETSLWITMHVLGALEKAKNAGYSVNLKTEALKGYLVWKLESDLSSTERLDLLYLMCLAEDKIDYNKYIAQIKEKDLKNLEHKFRLIELKQLLNLPYSTDSVYKYQESTLFGNIYFDNQSQKYPVWFNEVQATLSAYRIIRRNDPGNTDYLEKIRNYFFERRRLGRWQNTFESASIIETILPDLLKDAKGNVQPPVLVLSGSVRKTVTEFPFELATNPGDSINIVKTGTFPVYLSSFQHYWKNDPSADSTWFTVSTSFSDNPGILKAGKPVKMNVRISVRKDAQYVMIEVPVPAGCSYESKNIDFPKASHTEFFRDHLALFSENLAPGNYEFNIDLLPRFTGRYYINPAKIELMYFPVFNANNSGKSVLIK